MCLNFISYLTPHCQNLLQSNGNQVSEMPAQRQTYDEWNRIESQKINPYICGQLISTRGKTIQWRKEQSSTNGAGNTGYPHAKE